MSLSVLNVAYPFAAVGPDAVGGAEQVLTQLDAALVRAGHRSIVIACERSTVLGTLLALPAVAGVITEVERRATHAHCRRMIDAALHAFSVDVMHFHGVDFARYLPETAVPALATLHLPPAWYPRQIFDWPAARVHLTCVAAAQCRACPPGARIAATIDNGVATDVLVPRRKRGRYAMALGRICPEKGFHLALDAARRIRMPLLLGGNVFPYVPHRRYFALEIVPRLDAHRRFLGPLSLIRKRRLLAAARCVVIPSVVPETSSLVAMEALACGTPVVAFASGALIDIVEPGVTGFIVRATRELPDAMIAAADLDSAACRAAATNRFAVDPMLDRYLQLYGALANDSSRSDAGCAA